MLAYLRLNIFWQRYLCLKLFQVYKRMSRMHLERKKLCSKQSFYTVEVEILSGNYCMTFMTVFDDNTFLESRSLIFVLCWRLQVYYENVIGSDSSCTCERRNSVIKFTSLIVYTLVPRLYTCVTTSRTSATKRKIPDFSPSKTALTLLKERRLQCTLSCRLNVGHCLVEITAKSLICRRSFWPRFWAGFFLTDA